MPGVEVYNCRLIAQSASEPEFQNTIPTKAQTMAVPAGDDVGKTFCCRGNSVVWCPHRNGKTPRLLGKQELV